MSHDVHDGTITKVGAEGLRLIEINNDGVGQCAPVAASVVTAVAGVVLLLLAFAVGATTIDT